MTEIRVDVDLQHPPERVWRALTEAHLVTDWLPATQFAVMPDGTFTFRAGRLDGFDDEIAGQLLSSEAPHRMVMRWEAPNLRTVVTLTITPRATGSRLTLTQSGFLGPQGAMRRRVLRSTYTRLLEGPLVATLRRIADDDPDEPGRPGGEAPPRRNDGGPFNRLPRQNGGRSASASAPGLSSQVRSTAGPRPTTIMPGLGIAALGARRAAGNPPSDASAPTEVPPPAAGPPPGNGPVRSVGVVSVEEVTKHAPSWTRLRRARAWTADRRSQAVAAGVAVLLLIAMVALLVSKATTPHAAREPQAGGYPATARSAAPLPSPSVLSSPTSALTATFRIESAQPAGYQASITIANPTGVPVDDWTIVIMLPSPDLAVSSPDGAVMSHTGGQVILTPTDATRTVRGGGTMRVRLQVSGVAGTDTGGRPITCSIDGRPCVGIPG